MNTLLGSSLPRWIWRGAPLLALVLGLVFAPIARAETGYSTITVYAPGAPAGAWVGVQWQDSLGTWHDVENWQSEIEKVEPFNLSFKQWAVYSEDYGRGPFRWIIYAERGGPVWATSTIFYLPDGDGASLTMTLAPKIVLAPAEAITAVRPREALLLEADSSTWGLSCGTTSCDYSLITMYAPEAPSLGKIGVQWQDGFGMWHDVRGWQGDLDLAEGGNTPFKQWAITSGQYGRGPFRWVVYTDLGDTVWGVSPSFTLPRTAGLNLNLFLSR